MRINTEAQFTFPMVRVKLIQDSALHIGSDIQGYLFIEHSPPSKFPLFSLTNLGPDLLVAVNTGLLYRISWDGLMHQHLTLSLSALTYTISLNSDRGLFDRLRSF